MHFTDWTNEYLCVNEKLNWVKLLNNLPKPKTRININRILTGIKHLVLNLKHKICINQFWKQITIENTKLNSLTWMGRDAELK